MTPPSAPLWRTLAGLKPRRPYGKRRRRNAPDTRRLPVHALLDMMVAIEPHPSSYETADEYGAAHWQWDDTQRALALALRNADRRKNPDTPSFSTLLRQRLEHKER